MGENFAILLLLLLFLFIAIKMWHKLARPIFFKGIATGRVVLVQHIEDRNQFKQVELPLFEFVTNEGKRISASPVLISPSGRFKVGEVLSLRYNIKNPQECIINSAKPSFFTFPLL